jgi:uncharacterized protein YeeX (DUF496 family)
MAETLKETLKEAVTEVIKETEAKVEKIEQAIRVEISDAEKLVVRNLENEFLKAQMEMQRLTATLKNIQEQFPKLVDTYVKKYALDPAVYVFDAVELAFKKK